MVNLVTRTVLVFGIALGTALGSGPVGAQGVVVDPSGNVGIGTSTPSQLLEVNGGNSSGQLLSITTTGNNVRFGLDSSLASWTFANQASTKLRIREDASPAIAFELDSSGNLLIAGAITATAFNPPSSRATKTDIVPVDERAVLAAVAQLPVFKWRYKSDETKTSQIGPMAEDFRDAFGIGDGTHVSLVAANGLSFAAIKGLNAVVDENNRRLEALLRGRNREIERLRRTNAQFAERLAALEARQQSGWCLSSGVQVS